MKRVMRRAALVLAALLAFSMPPVFGAEAELQGKAFTSTQTPSLIFRPIETRIRRQSAVPLKLPTFLPYLDEQNPIYASIGSANKSHYRIILGYGKDCEGGPTCLYAEFEGSSTPFREYTGETRIPVALQGGIKGYFINFTCGANCSESYIGWTEGGFHYFIGMKAEKKEMLIKIANSAIGGQPQE